MTTPALRHFLEHALEVHAPDLADAFPACYDWQRMCGDVPAMVERLSEGRVDAADRAFAQRVVAQADVVFRTAHVVGLAVICAADDDSPDPEDALERLGEGADDEAEERFDQLVGDVLEPAEAFFADPTATLDARGVEVHRLHAIAWPHAAEYVTRLDALFTRDEAPGGGEAASAASDAAEEATAGVLLGVARLAVLLAGMRWMAAAPDDALPG